MDLISELFNSDTEAIRQITDALPAGVYIADTKGQLIYFNPAALEKWGQNLELGSRRWLTQWNLYYPDGSPIPYEKFPMVVALEEERPVTGVDMIAERPDGKKIDCIAHSSPLYNDDNELTGCITLLTVPAGQNDETVPMLQGEAPEREEPEKTSEAVKSEKEDPSEELQAGEKPGVPPSKDDLEKEDSGRDDLDDSVESYTVKGEPAKGEKLADMIDRRHAERILRKNEEKYRTLVENFPNGAVGLFDKDLRYTAVGGDLVARLGVTPEERIGNKVSEIYPEDLVWEVEPHFKAALQGKESSFGIKFKGLRLLAHTLPIKDDQGEVFAGMLVIQDVTERWQAQQDLKKSEQKYRTLFESMNEGFCILQVEFNDNREAVDFEYVEVNSAFHKQAGLDQAQGKKASEVLTKIEQEWVDKYAKVVLTGEPEHFESYSEDLDRWFIISAFRLGDKEDRTVAVLFNNITDRKENEINNAYLSSIVDSSDDAIISLDLDGVIRSWNESAEEIFGYTADDATGRSIMMLIPEDQRDQEKEVLQNVRHGENVDHYETIRVRKDGSQVNISLNISRIKDPSGNIAGISMIARDITERVRAKQEREQVLREVETERQRLIDIFKRAPSFMSIVREPDHVFERANDLYYRLTGNRELVGKPVREALPEVVEQGFVDILDHVYETGEAYTATDQRVLLRRDESKEPEERYLDFVFQPLFDADGEVTGIFIQGVDLTERKRAKEELQKINEELEDRVEERTSSLLSYQEQLRSLSSQLSRAEEQERHRLATELHDNLGQMLAVSKMKIELLQKDMLPPDIEQQVEDIKEGVKDALFYTRDLMSDLKPPPSLDKEDVTATIEWVAWKMEKHDLEVTIEDDGKQKRTSQEIRTTLLQSVREALFNVVKHAGVNQAHIRMSRIDGEVQIVVEDQGQGFDPSSTSSSSEGGFGLFNIKERLDLLGGEVDIDSVPGEGTKVTLIAPAKKVEQEHQAEDTSREKDTAPATERKQSIKVMLVDDHQMIRDGLRKIVNDEQDMQVVAEASDGEEALEKARESRPDIVVMDVNMPRMNGIDATREITDLLPEVRVIGLSLHDHEEVVNSMRRAGAMAYITKNEAFETLVATIRSEVT